MSYNIKMQDLFHRYEDEVSRGSPVDLKEMGAWAIREGLWQPRPSDINQRFATEMADALRQEFRTDKKGRNYRANHAVRYTEKGRQGSFWADIDNAPRGHMEKAIGQRRKQIVGDSYQLRVDVDHYNEDNQDQEQIPLVLDFTDDVEELLVANDLVDDAA